MQKRLFKNVYRNLLVLLQAKVTTQFSLNLNSKACEKCKNEKRKTINGDDILFAMNTLGFENYFDILHTYL